MTDRTYHVLKFTPDPVRDEPLNIGLVLLDADGPKIDIPDEALERAATWCSTLDRSGLVSLREELIEELGRKILQAEDTGRLGADLLPEMMGTVHHESWF